MVSAHKPVAALELKNVSMQYGEFRALAEVSLTVAPGEIHAIVGEHGAGKSSLAMIMSGFLRPGAGRLFVHGQEISQYSLKTAQRLGVRMIYQQTYLNEHFSVGENLFYTSRSSTRFGFYSRSRTEERARSYLAEHGFDIDPRVKLRALSLSDRTVIELLKSFNSRPRILILDESLEKLSQDSYQKIIPILKAMRDEGSTIVTITHRIDDVYRLANTVTVLKQGTRLITDHVENINKFNLIRMAYTQVGAETTHVKLDTEFYQFIKYNEAILQYLPVNIVVVDDASKVKMVNERCARSFGLVQGEYANTPLSTLFAGNDHAIELIDQSIEAREPRTFYNVDLRINESATINNIKTYPVYDGYHVIGTTIVIEDITEYDHLQKQLILSEKLASVGLLAAGVAHEINNPLEIISNYLSYVKYTHPEPEVTESIDKVNKEIDYISKIVSNLVTFSDQRGHNGELVDLNGVIGEILELLKYNAEYKHVAISFDHETGPLCFLGDEDQMKQVILNLIKNSFDAMESGGEIRITTLTAARNGDATTRLIFEDSGPGINAKDPNTIFLPFFSTKSARKKQLGLGLSISYRIVESFGGDMRAENLPVRGARFIIDLPLNDCR